MLSVSLRNSPRCRLDYQPLFRKMSLRSSPKRRLDSWTRHCWFPPIRSLPAQIEQADQNKFQDGGCEGTVRLGLWSCSRPFQSGKFERLATEGIRKASNMHTLDYVTDTIGWSRVQPSLLGKARGTKRAAEIEPSWSWRSCLITFSPVTFVLHADHYQ